VHLCSVENCKAPSETSGLCNKHYQRLRRTGTTSPGPLSPELGIKMCIVAGCGRKQRANSLCDMHHQRLRNTGTTGPGPKARGSLEDRFWRKVEKTPECWIWQGKREKNQYGRIQAGGKGSPQIGAHRLSYEIHHGPIPDGHVVMHSCDNPRCVNPDHLSVGLPRDNTADMIAKGRKRVVAPLGTGNGKAVLDEQKVRYIRSQPQTSHAALARELGVATSTVRGVRDGRCWSHVQ
jgi:hypothetical protein